MTRLEKAARAKEMRDRGMLLREIAGEMGVAISTASDYLNDPDGSKVRARKDSYRGTCESCGARTDGSNGLDAAPSECRSCREQRQHDERRWTPERLIEAVHEFNRRYGHRPTAGDWRIGNVTAAQRERCRRDGCWPPNGVILREFGTFGKLIEAAGFPPVAPGHYFHNPRPAERVAA